MSIILSMKHGRHQLRDWITRRAFTQIEAAEYLEFDPTVISSLLSGRRLPGRTNAVKLERATGIPVESWLPIRLDKSAGMVADAAENPNNDKV